MRLCTYADDNGAPRVGVVTGDQRVVDIGPGDVAAFLARASRSREQTCGLDDGGGRPLSGVKLLAPCLRPTHFFAVGLNYADHARDMGRAIPDEPVCFLKPSGCVVGPDDAIVCPAGFSSLDYEGELAIVIGKICRDVPEPDAMSVVGGFTIVNDVTVREWLAPDRLSIAKGFDTFGPMGPWLVTPDTLGSVEALSIRTWVDEEMRQHSSTAHLIFSVPKLIAWLTRGRTLYPGDVISTGSPAGSGASFDPPRFLMPGQMVRIEIEGIGALSNVIAEDFHEPS